MSNPENLPKKLGRKPKNPVTGTQTAAQRKRAQRERQQEAIATTDSDQWTEAECLFVLANGKWPAGSPMDRGAWRRLGELRGYVKA